MKNINDTSAAKSWVVEEASLNQRLDLYLVQHLGLSRRHVQDLIKRAEVLVNHGVPKASYRLKNQDHIGVTSLETVQVTDAVDEHFNLEILFEDNDLLVINKPVGVLVYPFKPNQIGTLVDSLWAHTNGQLAQAAGAVRPGIVHRLDRNTEGLLLVAKTDRAYDALKEQFKNRTIEKRYYARVKGDVEEDEFWIEKSIGRQKMGIKQDIHPESKSLKEARTHVTVLKRYQSATLLDIRLITGRTHQIRVHLSAMGHPVLGDVLYGDAAIGATQKLQAYYLGFTHPSTQKWIHVEQKISDRLLSEKECQDSQYRDALYKRQNF